ncbi:MAG: hypothetical protein JSV46_02160 [Candidatus Aminicenantes bacterium]|nr:MAG: hypothetical protein JSV46_02160 [Candidatus Aminicenantes bacterium]
MFRKQDLRSCLVFVPLVIIIGLLAGCAAKTADPWGDPKTGLILQYRMTENQVLKYQTSGEQTQNMEIMGQSIETQSSSGIEFSVKSKGLQEGNLLLGVTIDSMNINISSPQGELSPDMSTVRGKGFDMTLSPLGKELDVSGAESIRYDMGAAGSRSIGSNFQAAFPDLAGKPVKIGDSWTSTDTIIEKTDELEVRISFESVNTLEGFETVDGLECVKVTADITGALEGKGEQMGLQLAITGEVQGKATWYFAYKEGIFVKDTTSFSSDSTITTSGAQALTIPVNQETKMGTKLVK